MTEGFKSGRATANEVAEKRRIILNEGVIRNIESLAKIKLQNLLSDTQNPETEVQIEARIRDFFAGCAQGILISNRGYCTRC